MRPLLPHPRSRRPPQTGSRPCRPRTRGTCPEAPAQGPESRPNKPPAAAAARGRDKPEALCTEHAGRSAAAAEQSPESRGCTPAPRRPRGGQRAGFSAAGPGGRRTPGTVPASAVLTAVSSRYTSGYWKAGMTGCGGERREAEEEEEEEAEEEEEEKARRGGGRGAGAVFRAGAVFGAVAVAAGSKRAARHRRSAVAAIRPPPAVTAPPAQLPLQAPAALVLCSAAGRGAMAAAEGRPCRPAPAAPDPFVSAPRSWTPCPAGTERVSSSLW